MRRYLLAAVTAVAAVTLFAGTAAAQPDDDPVSGDDRATAHRGNVVGKDCASLYEGSKVVATGDLTYSVDGSQTYLDITAVADGIEIVAVIVKGSEGYNEYLPAGLGALPWLDLHSPLASSGKPAQISHWFACGVEETTTTTTATESTTSSTSSTSETSSTSSTSTTDTSTPSSSSSSASVTTTTTTTSANVAPAADEDDLAFTGFSGGWLIALAAALLLGGAALLLVTRLRARR